MVLNATAQTFEQAEDLKRKISKALQGGTIATETNILLAKLQKIYQTVLLNDLDYALDKKIEQDLWNFGFKNKIEHLQARAKDKKNPRRTDSQTLLALTLQSATGFYLCLLHQICELFELDLPFRFKLPNIPQSERNRKPDCRFPQPPSCWYICQYCLVHLGDLARYNRQPIQADSFYRQALNVSPRNGQPYNQLGLLRAARGDKLGAAYFHARSLAVGGPFPPAANNLSRTLASGSIISNSMKGKSKPKDGDSTDDIESLLLQLNPQTYINNFIAVHYQLQTLSHLDDARDNIKALGSSLIALVATDKLDSEMLLEMCCLDLYAIFSITEGHKLIESQLSDDEKKVFSFSIELLVGMLNALLLPVHTRNETELLSYSALPAIKIILEFIKLHPNLIQNASFASRPQLWPGLCALLNNLQSSIADFSDEGCQSIPLPEDEELQGFLPVDSAFGNLTFERPIYRHRSKKQNKSPRSLSDSEIDAEMTSIIKEQYLLKKNYHSVKDNADSLKQNKNFVDSLRAVRVVELGKWLCEYQKSNGCDFFTIEDSSEYTVVFRPVLTSLETNADVMKTIQEISILREKLLTQSTLANKNNDSVNSSEGKDFADNEKDDLKVKSGDFIQEDLSLAPLSISEDEFREKVKEKRAGILKPQGSLEKARVEKALSRSCAIMTSPNIERSSILGDNTVDISDIQDAGSGSSTVSQDAAICSDVSSLLDPSILDSETNILKKTNKKTRTNVALQAIMKKYEDSNKQVKFISPPTTPENVEPDFLTLDDLSQSDRRVTIQPKAMKSLVERKTGGILSLKDKSGGYPHLVNVDSSAAIEEKAADANNPSKNTDVNPTIPILQETAAKSTIQYPPKPSPLVNYAPWSDGKTHFAKSDSIGHFSSPNSYNQMYALGAPMNPPYSYFSHTSENNANNIRLPVINPKEIDVRSMQKQRNSQNSFTNRFDQAPRTSNHQYGGYNHWPNNPESAIKQMTNEMPYRSEYGYGNFGGPAQNRMADHFSNPNGINQSPWWNPPNENPNFYNKPPPEVKPNQYGYPSFYNAARNPPFYDNQSYDRPRSNPVQQDMTYQTMSPIDAFNADYGQRPGLSTNYNVTTPEFVPKASSAVGSGLNRSQDANSTMFDPPLHESVNTYSLFSAPKSLWQDNEGQSSKSPWSTGADPSPLEKLLEKQKQFKPPSNSE